MPTGILEVAAFVVVARRAIMVRIRTFPHQLGQKILLIALQQQVAILPCVNKAAALLMLRG
jgi:hypothetical protein